MSAAVWAVVVAVVALVLSGTAAFFTYRQTRYLAGSGFKTAEDLKADIVALLAALRSVIYKGIAADQDNKPREVSSELARIRDFQASPSGYALYTLAAERGSRSGDDAGRWRVLGLHFAELCGLEDSTDYTDGSLALWARHWATEIESTLELLRADDVDWMAKNVSELPAMTASIVETRSKDMVARIWFELAEKQRVDADPARQLERLQALRASGVMDPTLDFWIAFLTHDSAQAEKALQRGADRTISAATLIARYGSDAETSR